MKSVKIEDSALLAESAAEPSAEPAVEPAPVTVTLELSDGSEEPLRPETLWVGDQDALYLKVKGGQFDARFTPAAQLALAPLVQEGKDGGAVLRIGPESYRVGSGRPG